MAVLICAAAISVVAGATGRPRAILPVSGAERFVGPDGHREILTGTQGTQVRQTGHQPGLRAWGDSPYWFAMAIRNAGWAQQQFWVVETEDDRTGAAPQLMYLDSAGLHTGVVGWPEIRSFDPARTEVPANPRPGQSVTSAGVSKTLPTADRPGEEVAYTSVVDVIDAESVGDGCLEFRRTDNVGDAEPIVSSRVRCPDRGVVVLDGPQGRFDAAPGWPPSADPRPALDLTDPGNGPLAGLKPNRVTFMRGNVPTLIGPAGPVGIAGDQIVVAGKYNGNLTWLDPAGDTYQLGPRVDVGGDFAGFAQCGEVLIAATSQRTVIAHDITGQWLWTTELSDVAGSRPIRSGADVLIATRDGRLTALGCRDGTIHWQTDGVASGVTPAVSPAGILVGGENSVRLLHAETGVEGWARNLPDRVVHLGFAHDQALVIENSSRLHSFTAADGTPRWNMRYASIPAEVRQLGSGIAIRTAATIEFVDRQGHSVGGQNFSARTMVADGSHLFAASLSGILVLDSTGQIVERVDQPMDDRAADLLLTRTPTGVIAIDGLGTIIDWRAE